MTLFEMYQLIELIVNKDFDGNIITPARFAQLVPVVNIDLFRKKYGLPESYQPGRPIPVEYVDITLKNTDDLKVFRKALLSTAVTNGILPYPVDYAHREEIVYNYTKTINNVVTSLPRPVEILRESQMAERRGNYTKQPTTKDPCGVMRLDGIHIYPTTITAVNFYYFRFPTDPVFAYTLGDGFITYDSANSVEFEWPEDEHMTLVKMMLSYIGVNLREADIVNYSEKRLKEG